VFPTARPRLALLTLLAVLAPASTAGAQTVLALDGGVLTVATTTQGGRHVELRRDGDALVVRANSRVQLPAGCTGLDWRTARCPLAAARAVRVTTGPGVDTLGVAAELGVPVHAALGGGDDRFNMSGPRARDHLDGGDGTDLVSYLARTEGVAIGPEGEDVLAGIERLEATRAGDRIVAPPGTTVVNGVGGPDVVDVRDGARQTVLCTAEGFVAADAADEVHCGLVDRPAGLLDTRGDPPGPPPVLRAPGRPDAATELVLPPVARAGTLELAFRAPAGLPFEAAVTAAPWRGGPAAPRVALARHGAPVAGPGGRWVSQAFALPPAVAEALTGHGRLRLSVTTRIALGAGRTVDRAFTVPIAGERRPRTTGDGVTRSGGFGRQTLVGLAGGDLLRGDSANDVLRGAGGADELLGGTGDDVVGGEAGHDVLDGGDGSDLLLGGPGEDDLVERRFGDDRLDGGAGDDVLRAGRGRDVLRGGPGDDVVSGGSGPDVVDCGEGEDVAYVNAAYELAQVTGCEHVLLEDSVPLRRCAEGGTGAAETVLGTEGADACRGAAGDDDLEGAGGDDLLDAGAGDDRLFGRFGADRLLGGVGDDELEGGRGRDRLDGGPGRDQLNGGFDADRLTGGDGDDRLVARGGGTDRVDCGRGVDVAVVDSRDRVRGCERVDRSGPSHLRRRAR